MNKIQVNHMDVFLALTLMQKLNPLITDDLVIRELSHQTGQVWEGEYIAESIRRYPPTTKHLVNALRDKGFAPHFISEYLNIKAPTVSYHLSHKPDKPYQNPVIVGFFHRVYSLNADC